MLPEQFKNTIFSADDFGISRKANENILKLAEAGTLDRVSVMTYGFLPKEDIERLLRSGVKLDLHADLKDGIDPKRKLTGDLIGRLSGFALDFLSGKNKVSSVEKRWEKQIEDFRTLFGKYPDGLNSHEHVHFFPPYFKILVKLSKEYRIRYVRLGRESFSGRSLVSTILRILRKRDEKAFLHSGLDTSDSMISFDWIGSFDELKKYSGAKKIELIFHPERNEEMEFLKSIENTPQ